ncbi:MAG: aminoglycoside adenylyltransferase domain-containing protein [Pyrinomonadaceae bacterium]
MNKNKIPALVRYPDIGALLDVILSRIQGVLGEKLKGLYLYGSLVAGDFDYEISDIDFLAALDTTINEKELSELEKMHDKLARENPRWNNRIEVAYVSLDALKTFKTKQSKIANTSPGEPLHFLEAGRDWLLNWHFARVCGVTLFGESPEEIIEPVSKDEFIENVRRQAAERAANVEDARHSRPYQAYLIMTLCRALYVVERGEQVSKRRAASWVKKKFPEYAALIENAFEWRAKSRDKNFNHEATFPEAREFILFIAGKIKESEM